MAHDLIRQEIGTKRAGEDMTAARGKAVVFNSLDRWQIAGLTGPLAGLVHGILTNNPASGRVASVQVFGIAMARLGGTVTGGRYLDVDTNGDLIESHPNGTVGVALESGVAGSVISVFLISRIAPSAIDHGALAGLGDDDHPQYHDGSLAYTGDLDLGTNDIINVGLVDGIDVSVHVAAFAGHQLTIDDHGDVDITTSPPTVGEVLGWDGSSFVPVSQATFGEYVGIFDASGGSFPTANFQGDWFNTTVSGTVDSQGFIVGDILIALVDNPSTTTFAGNWTIVPTIASGGDVVGPGSSLDNALSRYSGTTGKLIQDSLVTLDDLGALSGLTQLDVSGDAIVSGDIINKGVTWVSRTSASDNDWRDITFGNNLYVMVSSTGSGDRVQTSEDGIIWTLQSGIPDRQWRGVIYGNGLFVAVASDGTGDRVMTSPDGKTWTSRTSAADNQWRNVTYGQGLFVAVSNDGGSTRAMTSPDGINWTLRTTPATRSWRSVTYGNNLFVAVASNLSGSNNIMTSPDGITWTIRVAPGSSSEWRSVTYGAGFYVAVSRFGTGNRVMKSVDGITWTFSTSAADNNWRGVGYGDGLFVAVADTGAGNRVMTSPDAINWTLRTSAADINWIGISFGNGVFTAGASSGSGNRIMTSGKADAVVAPSDNIYHGATVFTDKVTVIDPTADTDAINKRTGLGALVEPVKNTTFPIPTTLVADTLYKFVDDYTDAIEHVIPSGSNSAFESTSIDVNIYTWTGAANDLLLDGTAGILSFSQDKAIITSSNGGQYMNILGGGSGFFVIKGGSEVDFFDKVGVIKDHSFNVRGAGFIGDKEGLTMINCRSNWTSFGYIALADEGQTMLDIALGVNPVSIRGGDISLFAGDTAFLIHNGAPATARLIIETNNFGSFIGTAFGSNNTGVTGMAATSPVGGTLVTPAAGARVWDGDTLVGANFATDTIYNVGGITVSNTILNEDGTAASYEIDILFDGSADLTGDFTMTGLDQTDPKILCSNNSGVFPISRTIGSVFVRENTDIITINTIDVYEDLDLGTASGGSNIERFSLASATTGELTYDGLAPFSGIVNVNLSVLADAGSPEYHFRVIKNGAALPDDIDVAVECPDALTTVAASFLTPITLVAGDTIRVQVRNADNTNDVTINHFSMSIQ